MQKIILPTDRDTFGGFPKLGGTLLLGVPIIRIVVFWDLYWGLPFGRKCTISARES